MGVETPEPVLTDKCLRWNFTNEGGVGDPGKKGNVRLLKNITGLWLVQECRRVWSEQGHRHSWETLSQEASAASELQSFIDPDATAFQTPGDMPEAIRAFCRQTGQPLPADAGAVIRTCLESLALRYRYVLGALEDLTEGQLETVHIVGGGTQNRQLCQAAADATNRRVVTGPIEATVIGNVVVQAIAAGAIGSIAEGREIVRRSFPVEEFKPRNTTAWDDAYEKFLTFIK
jgi:rhamnulokinase